MDVLIDLDPDQPIGLFDYAEIKLYVAELFGADTLDGPVDVVNGKTPKEGLRERILRDAVDAF